MQITQLRDFLFSSEPDSTLYHYTSLNALTGIVDGASLWATEVRYLNDASEMSNAADHFGREASRRIREGSPHHRLLEQFVRWVTNRLTHGHMLFVASFTTRGNLLSQWRSYSTPAKGVSIGFDQMKLLSCARKQSFRLGRCVYRSASELATPIVDALEHLALAHGETEDRSKRPAEESYYGIFESVESELLQIASLIKHGSF